MRCEALVRSGRHVVIVGDLNACYRPVDHVDFAPTTLSKHSSAGHARPPRDINDFIQHPARTWMRSMLREGGGLFVDLFAHFQPDRLHPYTCWNVKVSQFSYAVDTSSWLLVCSQLAVSCVMCYV
jgi:AP endonuclease-2